MARPRALLAVGALLCVAALVAVTAGPAAAADARLTVTDATVSPATPAAGAPITVEATVQLSAGSDTPLSVEAVRVVGDGGDGDTLGTAGDLGTLSPGESLTVPVTLTVEEARVHDLELVAVGTDAEGERARATRPLTVGVERGTPQLSVEAPELVAGADRPVRVNVSNPTTAPIRGIELRATVPGGSAGARETIPALAAGATETVTLPVAGVEAGDTDLTVRAAFTDPTGDRRNAELTRTVTVEPPSVDVGVRVAPADGDDGGGVPGGLGGVVGGDSALQQGSDGEGEDGRVEVTVTNFGNAPVERVVLRGESTDGAVLGAVGRIALADRLGPGESASATVDVSAVRGVGDLRFVAGYTAPAGRAESGLRYDRPTAPGNATVTGLSVTRENGVVRVEGNLANTGDADLAGAVVRVRPGEHVGPAYPQRSYFVGTVAGGEFVPFEVTADADPANATAVTLRVSYAAGGERVTDTVRAPLPDSGGEDGGIVAQSSFPAAALAAAAGALTLVAGGIVLRRRRR